jgi:DNA-binding LacI/PurR family transcriptional regulator
MTVRLEDVARASAVSLATASIALRGDGGRLARKTVNRIREVAAGLDYIPDAASSQLARGSPTGRSGVFWGTLAHLGPDPLFTQAIKDTKARGEPDDLLMVATELGYRLEYFALPSDPRGIAALARVLHSRGISGLVVNFHNEHWTGNFPWHDFKVIR